MKKGPLLVVTAAVGALAAAYAVRRLLENPEIRAKIEAARDKIRDGMADLRDDVRVDRAGEESFPASDSPSHAPEKAIG